MKKGDKRVRVKIKDKKTGEVIGEKDIYERNQFAGQNGWLMSWDDRNKAPKYNSKRQTAIRERNKKNNPLPTQA